MRGAFALAHFVATNYYLPTSFAGFGASLADRKEGLSLLGTEEKLVGVLAVAVAAEC